MSTEMDFKALWNKQPIDAKPDIKQVIMRAEKLKRIFRYKVVITNVVLLPTAALVIYVGFTIDKAQMTTKIGVILEVIAYLTYLIAYNQLIPLILKTNPEISNQDYLNQLIIIKRKDAFLDSVITNIYFACLSLGVFLFMVQPVMRMTPVRGIIFYLVIGLCLAFTFFYLRPYSIRKKQKTLNDIIAKLEQINGQLET